MLLNVKTSEPSFGKILGTDHITFWVGNAKQAASYYTSRFGFEYLAYKGLETGERAVASHVIRNNQRTTFVFCSVYHRDSSEEMNRHLIEHGDGVKDISFTVENSRAIYEHAIANGAVSVRAPYELTDENGTVVLSAIKAYGDVIHTFVQRSRYTGIFLPGYKPHHLTQKLNKILPQVKFQQVDHVVGNQPDLQMQPVVQHYQKIMNLHRFWSADDKIIHTEYSALRSIVMTDYNENIKIPITEPAIAKKKSQVQEFVDYYHGPGAQHIALRTETIIETVAALVQRGVEFLTVPDTYYDIVRSNLPNMAVKVAEDIDMLQKYKILIDHDQNGYLLQILSKPVEDRPTLFFEVIQRRNHEGFGAGNFKNLFQAIEVEQAKRGNL